MEYAELHAVSAFSFLDGASLPEDLAERAAELGLSAVALTDRDGVYGAPRFYKAAKALGLKALVGAEITLEEAAGSRLTLLAESRVGYRNLCRLLTAAAEGRPKGEARAGWELVESFAVGLHVLTGGDEGPLAAAWARREGPSLESCRAVLRRLAAIFPGRVHVEVQRHHEREEARRTAAAIDLAEELKLPLLATNGARYARALDKELHDALCCIRWKTTLDEAGERLAQNRERHLKSAVEMARLFHDLPEALAHARELAARLEFTLDDLGYQFPDFPLPPGETTASFLRKLTWERAPRRFDPYGDKAKAQLERELALIEKLDLAGYFLIVHDVVEFCRRENILVQGRGSAANSAVCYALSITAVDPVKMDLLFERFLSEERGEWPDIDLDLPSGDQREKAIQYVYAKYGARGAAMTANVITYRQRLAVRDLSKALGYSAEQIDKLARGFGSLPFGFEKVPPRVLERELLAAGLSPKERRAQKLLRLWLKIQNLPRHLGQHSGGIVICRGSLDSIVPLEPAAMPGRRVIQWDKDDCADLGLIKIDLLGLGMLNALEKAFWMIETHEGMRLSLALIPQDDPGVYKSLREADTVGVFQLESRAQMASLPRHLPERFYDIVVQVAIIRPGPIVGGMIRPFFERRRGRAPVEYPAPCLEPILKRTLGVPLFQEQILRMAMAAGGFSGGEAEELRRAIGFKRSAERMEGIMKRLEEGMIRNGISPAGRKQIVDMISAFALYGFPESHAASFALIAYASAYLRIRHPAAFYASLLNAWPMGFYHPATIVKDAQRRGVAVLPVDVLHSGWECRWEGGGVRVGMRFLKGFSEASGRRVEAERARGEFADERDLAHRADLGEAELRLLAYSGALAGFGRTRREALWQAARVSRPAPPLFEGALEPPSPLPEMAPVEETLADYRGVQLTAGPHLLEYLRAELDAQGVRRAADLTTLPAGARVRVAGAVIVRQRPGTAKGLVFITLEDETGFAQAVVMPDQFERWRPVIVGSTGLIIEGELQNREGNLCVKAERVERLDAPAGASHDFH